MKIKIILVIIFLIISGVLSPIFLVRAKPILKWSKLAEAKKNFENSFLKYKNSAKEFREFREKYRGKVEIKSEEERKNFLEKNKNFLKNSSLAMREYLEVLKDRIQKINIPEAEKNNFILEIEEEINWLKAKETTLEDVSSTEELRQIAPELREHLKKIKLTLKRNNLKIVNSRLGFLLEKSEKISEKFPALIERIKKDGSRATNFAEQAELYKNKIAEIKINYSLAQENLEKIQSGEMTESLVKETFELFGKAKESLREAKEILLTITDVASDDKNE